MPITLQDAMENAATDHDYTIINEFIRQDAFLDQLTFDDAAVPGAGGGTIGYSYTRLVQERGAQVREYNQLTPEGEAAKRQTVGVQLVPFSDAYKLDRVLAHLGPRATDEVALQSAQAVTAVRTKVLETIFTGGRQADGTGYDGLDTALAGSTTELRAGEVTDWSGITVGDRAHDAIDLLDELVDTVDGEVSYLCGNRRTISKLRSIARRADYYQESRDEFGRRVETFNGIPFKDFGSRSGSAAPIIPVETRNVAGADEGGLTDLYAVRFGIDGFHGVSVAGHPLLQSWLPNFDAAGAVKEGEVEMGPVAFALKRTKSAAVLRNVRL